MRILLLFFGLYACSPSGDLEKVQNPSQESVQPKVDTVHSYSPSRPIDFPHEVHSGQNGINCNYCHQSVEQNKTTTIRENICLSCHQDENSGI